MNLKLNIISIALFSIMVCPVNGAVGPWDGDAKQVYPPSIGFRDGCDTVGHTWDQAGVWVGSENIVHGVLGGKTWSMQLLSLEKG
jgi:hypothetical protein